MSASSIQADPKVQEALAFWREYQTQHDVSERLGQAVGLDPVGRRVWFGVNASAVAAAARADGVNSGVLVIRVGRDYYVRKGGRR
jgi:hypothetical protein